MAGRRQRICAPVHPAAALFRGTKPFPVILPCVHCADSEKLIFKALQLQDSIGPVLDLTCDREDGAQAGRGTLSRGRQ